MTSKAFTSAGTQLFISASAPATYNSVGFAALTWTEIGEVSEMGEFGRQYNLVTFNTLGDRRTVKRKGSYNDGTIACQMARVPDDAGQTIITAAVDSDSSYSIKIVLQDGTVFYTSAQVMSYTTNIGNVDQITSATVNLEIDNDILEVPVP
jgi:hypothetical protein